MIGRIRAFLASHPGLPGILGLVYKTARNLAFAVWNLILALWYGSWWYLTAGVYHGLLGGIRTAAALSGSPDKSDDPARENASVLTRAVSRIGTGEGGKKLMTAAGIVLVCLSVVVAGTSVLSIRERIADVKGLIPVIGTAAFTFFKMTAAIVSLARKRAGRSPKESTLRCVALSDASMAMFTLERTMIASIDGGGLESEFFVVMTASLGMAVFLVTLGAGVFLLIKAARMSRKGQSESRP
ncbi:MAG: hypothetical protein E7576_00715 [Ruminococcaceae bacterium]|jgi:hypothetical protein|nr:hypothetical protein [Oscillospiraceae bacterium]